MQILPVFIICHGLKFIPNMYEIQQGVRTDAPSWPEWIEYVSSISHLLITLNASSDVFIYFIKHRAGHDNVSEDGLSVRQ